MDKYYDPVTKIISVPEPEQTIFPDGLGCLMFQRMKENANKIAQIDADTGESETNSSLLERCVRVALEIQKRGLTRNDVISICSHNSLDSAVPYIAAFLLGVKVACLDPSLSLDETKYLINLVKPKLIFTSSEAEELINKSVQESLKEATVIVFGETQTNLEFKEFLLPKPNENDFKPEPIDINETAVILFSSGSTGLPKGICWSHKLMLYATKDIKYITSAIGFATLYWATTSFKTIACVLNGIINYFAKSFHPKRCWEYFVHHKIDYMFLSPCDTIRFYRNKPDVLPNIPCLAISGSCMSEEHLQNLTKTLPKTQIVYIYGQTEMMGALQSHSPILKNKITSAGIPMPGKSYKIVDPETEETLGFNQRGELRVKTEWCMSGYYDQDSSSAWDSEGFLKTGDIGYYDEEFSFFIVDRIKEMFKYKSWRILPAQIENVLSSHPDVKYCAIIGIPHPEEDNHIMAVVQLVEGSKATAEEIKEFVESRMNDRHKLRAGLKIINEMPLTPSTKVKRAELKRMALEGRL